MTQSIVVIRLTRNLRYKLTYIKIFEAYLESITEPEIAELLKLLIQAQQLAVGPLSRYLRHLEVNVQELELDDKLMSHAMSRGDLKSRMRFIYDGLKRAVAWYKTQLLDKQMVADPELRSILLELGEIDAAKLWRTEAVMAMFKMPTEVKEKTWEEELVRAEPESEKGWRPRLMDEIPRPSWTGTVSPNWSGTRRPSRKSSRQMNKKE